MNFSIFKAGHAAHIRGVVGSTPTTATSIHRGKVFDHLGRDVGYQRRCAEVRYDVRLKCIVESVQAPLTPAPLCRGDQTRAARRYQPVG